MSKKFKQGRYIPKNPQKYIGDPSNIIYRSSWEKKFNFWLDNCESVLAWSSEPFYINYWFSGDNQYHKYYPDYYAKIQDKDGNITEYIIEVKPKKDMIIKQPKKISSEKTKINYINNILTVEKNRCKWEAIQNFCKEKGFVFKVITEDELF